MSHHCVEDHPNILPEKNTQSSSSKTVELLQPFAFRILCSDDVKKGRMSNCGRLLLVSEYWMGHGLFRTNRDGKGRVAASSHRFTPSILKLLDYTRRGARHGRLAGRQAGRSGKENDSYSLQEVKHSECKSKKEELSQSVHSHIPFFFFFFLIVLHQRGNRIGRYSRENLQALRKYRGKEESELVASAVQYSLTNSNDTANSRAAAGRSWRVNVASVAN